MADTGGGFSSVDTGGMTAADYADDENFDQSAEQDKAMAAFGGGDGPDTNTPASGDLGADAPAECQSRSGFRDWNFRVNSNA